MPMARWCGLGLFAFTMLSGCFLKKKTDETETQRAAARQIEFKDLAHKKLCVAMRGNGELIMAHMSSLARITEDVGLIDGGAGGSSASISLFLYESMIKNPEVWKCAGGNCDTLYYRKRISFLLKSMWGFLASVGESPQAKAVLQLGSFAASVKKLGILALLDAKKVAEAHAALTKALSDPLIKGLLNPEILKMVNETNPALRSYYIRQIVTMIQSIESWSAEDKTLFFRPSLLSFDDLADKAGKFGNFYAGYTPQAAQLGALMDRCAEASFGKTWFELKRTNEQCTDGFSDLANEYIQNFISKSQRVDEKVGATMPLLVPTSVLSEKDSARFREGFEKYMKNDGFSEFEFKVFSDLKFGYWGMNSETKALLANKKAYRDEKTSRAVSLGETNWKMALAYSPAEPGLSRLKDLTGTKQVSAGGWSDLHPTLALKNIGCEKVVYITRQGEESSFAIGVARQLGMSSDVEKNLYDLNTTASSFNLSIREADGVYCTNWNVFKATQAVELDTDAFRATLYSNDATLAANVKSTSQAPAGCKAK